MEEKIRNDLVSYLCEDYEQYTESAIDFCIKRAISSFRTKRQYPSTLEKQDISEDMERYYYCIFDLAVYYLMKQGAEFESLHIENGVHRTYQTEADVFLMHGAFSYVKAF